MTDETEAPPIACTLDTGSFRERQSWIANLNVRALLSSKRDGVVTILEYDRRALEDVRKFVRSEKACCGFLDFALRECGDKVLVTITAPEVAAEAADTLFQQFEAKTIVAAAPPCSCGPKRPAQAVAGSIGNKAVGLVAATASTAALACGVCCVLPFALPAAILGSMGSTLAWFSTFYRWLVPIAVLAVAAGWGWVGYQSWLTKRSPTWGTVVTMAFATSMITAAWMWPTFEPTARALLKALS